MCSELLCPLLNNATKFWLNIVPVAQYACVHGIGPFLRAHFVHFGGRHNFS